MRISKKAEYALRALVAISRHPGKSWSIQELATGEKIPIKFLEQILLSLRRAGILASKRGVGGGYTLLRNPADVSLGEVITIFDGPTAPVACAAEKPCEPEREEDLLQKLNRDPFPGREFLDGPRFSRLAGNRHERAEGVFGFLRDPH